MSQTTTNHCTHGDLQRAKLGVETHGNGVESCRGCGLSVRAGGEAARSTAPGWVTGNTPGVSKNRKQAASAWFNYFVRLVVVLALGSFTAFGNLYATGTDFSQQAGLAAALSTIIVWLPVIALFDYLRRANN